MPKKTHMKSKTRSRGAIGSGALYVMVILLVVITSAFVFSGGVFPQENPTNTGSQVIINPAKSETAQKSLQLYTFSGATVTLPPLPEGPPGNCGSVVTDTELIVDTSGSMQGSTLAKVKIASKAYVEVVSTNPSSRVGLIQFNESSELLSTLTSDGTTIKSAIDRITGGGSTCIQCGIQTTNQDIQVNKRAGIKNLAILLSDGVATRMASNTNAGGGRPGGGGSNGGGRPGGGGSGGGNTGAVAAAKAEILAGYKENGTVYYTIGFGNRGVNESFLKEVAAETGGQYYYSPSDSQLNQAFLAITQSVCK